MKRALLLIGLLAISNAHAGGGDDYYKRMGQPTNTEIFDACEKLWNEKGPDSGYHSMGHCNDIKFSNRRHAIRSQIPENCQYKAPVGMFRGVFDCE